MLRYLIKTIYDADDTTTKWAGAFGALRTVILIGYGFLQAKFPVIGKWAVGISPQFELVDDFLSAPATGFAGFVSILFIYAIFRVFKLENNRKPKMTLNYGEGPYFQPSRIKNSNHYQCFNLQVKNICDITINEVRCVLELINGVEGEYSGRHFMTYIRAGEVSNITAPELYPKPASVRFVLGQYYENKDEIVIQTKQNKLGICIPSNKPPVNITVRVEAKNNVSPLYADFKLGWSNKKPEAKLLAVRDTLTPKKKRG